MADTDTVLASEEGRLLPRLEKRSRQTLAKLGLKKVEGITRVVLRRPQGVLIIVQKPEVYKSANSDCYIVFGEGKVEDPNSGGFNQQAMAAAQAAEARHRAEIERQAKAAGRSVGDDSADAPANTSGAIDPFEGVADKDDKSASAASATKATEGDDEVVDETGLDASDIQTVMAQSNCSRAKAAKALRDNGNDLINAIMSIS